MCFRPSEVGGIEHRCPECGTNNLPEATMCANCFAPLEPLDIKAMMAAAEAANAKPEEAAQSASAVPNAPKAPKAPKAPNAPAAPPSPPELPLIVISSIPTVDMAKHSPFRIVSFSLKAIVLTTVIRIGAA